MQPQPVPPHQPTVAVHNGDAQVVSLHARTPEGRAVWLGQLAGHVVIVDAAQTLADIARDHRDHGPVIVDHA